MSRCTVSLVLKGKRVVVTGVSRGVGFEITKLFLAEGAEVLGIARHKANLAKANKTLSSFGKAYSSLLADVAKPASALKIKKAVQQRWKALDLLINNAGINPGHPSFVDESATALEDTLQINVLAPHRLIRALLPLLKKGRHPRVINVSSGAGSFHSVSQSNDMASYRLSKFTLNGLTMLFATHLTGQVSVVAMDPGWVKTDMGGPHAPDDPTLSAKRALAIALLPAEITGKYLVGDQIKGW